MPSSRTPLIGIDCRLAATHSGIGRYIRELVTELIKRDDPWRYHLFLPDQPISLDQLFPHPRTQVSYLKSHIYTITEQLELPRVIKESSINLLHVPHFNVPLRCPVPVITTIHDLILHDYPNEASIPKRMAYRMLMGNATRKAERIIAVSNVTAADIARHYGEDAHKKTTVIHNGLAERFHAPSADEIARVRNRYNLPERFLLYVGACKEHKNVQILIDAAPESVGLLIVSHGKETERLRLKPNVTILQNADDDDLPALYAAATAFVLPSLAEGFGMPVLEAMACGCPVVTSTRGSIPEIAGGHAILVEPTEEGLRNGINRALTEPFDGAAAMAHAASFTWKDAAEETAKEYNRIINF